MPYSVPLHVQLLTRRLFTPPCVGLPIDKPCPVPKVQLEIVISFAAALLLPIWILSSPSLIEQFWMRTFVEARSIPSVFGDGDCVAIFMFWIVIWPLALCTMIWKVGGFCSVTPWIRILWV